MLMLNKLMSHQGIAALVEIVCNLIPNTVRPSPSDFEALERAVNALWHDEDYVHQLMVTCFEAENPRALRDDAISVLRAELSEVDVCTILCVLRRDASKIFVTYSDAETMLLKIARALIMPPTFNKVTVAV